MPDKPLRPTHKDYIKLLETTGWDLITGSEAFPVKDQTLEQLLRTTHERNRKGETPGVISNMDIAELTLAEMEKLWEHLGLPM
ncbi:MAG: hypothetical protein P4M13_11185 [Alphaproteobacteria bacterium]|nr:hypothetical protein [Alphaproteobacteria bacterium]